MWLLRTADEADLPFTFRILPGSIKTIGRAARADFVVDAALVSRLHCRLTAGADGARDGRPRQHQRYLREWGTRGARQAQSRATGSVVGRVELLVDHVAELDPITRSENGFVRRSCPIVVSSPWPDQTTVSSGKRKRTSRIERSRVFRSPPGRSVRPIDPANSVSPTNSVELLLAFPAHGQAYASRTVSGRVQHADLVLPEAQRLLPLVEVVDRGLRLDAQSEHLSLLDDPLVEEVVGAVQPDRNGQGVFCRGDAGDMVQVSVGQQDADDRERVLRGRGKQLVDFVTGIDDHTLPCLVAADDESVLEKGLDRTPLDDHRL